MRVLVLGGGGMLGHKLFQVLSREFDTFMTARSARSVFFATQDLVGSQHLIDGVDAQDLTSIEGAIRRSNPDVIANCIGIVKQLREAKDPIVTIAINSLFPHQLESLCQKRGARLIHMSTDCVFSGRAGLYKESDIPDAVDLYGRSKLLGEVAGSKSLTIRTSIVGREISTEHGLVEWFLGQEGPSVKGFTSAVFSGFPIIVLSGILAKVIQDYQALQGLYHVSANPIDKFHLLQLLRDAFGKNISIEASDEVRLDRSLDSHRFRSVTGFEPDSWPEMIAQMASDPTPYNQWRA